MLFILPPQRRTIKSTKGTGSKGIKRKRTSERAGDGDAKGKGSRKAKSSQAKASKSKTKGAPKSAPKSKAES